MDTKFQKIFEPLYFDVTRVPDSEFADYFDIIGLEGRKNVTDIERKQVIDFAKRSEIIDSTEPVALKSHPIADIWMVKSTDPYAVFSANGNSFVLGKGTYCFFRRHALFCQFFITHKGPYEIHYYSIRDMVVREAIFTAQINCFIKGELFVYKDGTFSKCIEPYRLTLHGEYKKEYTSGNTKTTFVYSHTITNLQSHPNMKEYAVEWDKEFVRTNNPPCISVSILADVKAEEAFRKFAIEVCPDVKFEFDRRVDYVELKKPTEETDKKMQQDLNRQVQKIQMLINRGILTYDP